MDSTAVAVAGVLAGAVAAFTWPASSDKPVTATYGCNSATFANHTQDMVRVSHGVPRSSAVTDVFVPAGGSITVATNTSALRWWASSPDGTQSLVTPGRAVDLTARCGGSSTASPTPVCWTGLAATGH